MAERVQVVIEDMDALIEGYKETVHMLEIGFRIDGDSARNNRAIMTEFRRTLILLATARLEILQLRLERSTVKGEER